MRNKRITPLYERLSRDDDLQGALNSEIADIETAITGFEESKKSAEKFIALIDKHENFDTLANTTEKGTQGQATSKL